MSLHEARRVKLAAARHRRREQNLKLPQPTLPLEAATAAASVAPARREDGEEGALNHEPAKSHCG